MTKFIYLQLECKKDAFSPELQQYCQSQPVVVIRGMAGALKLGIYLSTYRNTHIFTNIHIHRYSHIHKYAKHIHK